MTRLTLIPLFAVALGSAPVLAGPELTKAYILSILKDAKPDIDDCGRGLHESVKVNFTIDASGDVRDVRVDGKHARDPVGSCMKQKLSALRFGPSLKAMPIHMAFHFGDDETAAAAGGKKLEKKEVAELLKVLQSNMSSCGTGVVQSKFMIQPDGQVRQVKIEGDHADDQVGKCVQTKLSRARFPQAPAATPVTHEFRLE